MLASTVGLATVALAACGSATAISGTDSTELTATAVAAASDGLSSIDTHVDEDDLTWNTSEEQAIALADAGSTTDSSAVTVDGSTVTITAGGVYRVSGTLSDGQLVIAAPEDESVTVILDGASITSSTGPAISVTSADETTLYLAVGTESTVADGSGYTVADDATPVAAIASTADLTLAGEGSLSVTGNTNDGISSVDGLAILGGTLSVTAADDGIRGKDYVTISDGEITITAGGDALKADNAADADRGWILVSGGTLTLDAGDDAVKGEQAVEISGGTVSVASSTEGIESAAIVISGGDVSVTSSDDGLNAVASEDAETSDDAETSSAFGPGGGMGDDGSTLTISGGTLAVDAEGDGLDSNGSLTIAGGMITVNGPTNAGNGAVDVNGTYTVTGGSLVTADAGGMVVTPGENSAHTAVQFSLSSAASAGDTLEVQGSSGATVASITLTKSSAAVVASGDWATDGESYSLVSNGTEVATATTGEVTTSSMGRRGGAAGGAPR